ncbi:unnamed protein product [Callosobruchus maculatus]|uniref:Invertebrate defensins family profile domain-containing protein n=1 Tax=Callosobruchus maculatus TaxID=64391 RepID=A0A653D7H0_CALMS|nr:unnamed protein product [Callosobruchus maculatus]
MKSALVLLIVALIAVASALPADASKAVGGKWTGEQLDDHLSNVIPATVTCINVRCRTSCVQNGAVAGYCAGGECNCVVPGPRGV